MHKEMSDSVITENLTSWKAFFVTSLSRTTQVFDAAVQSMLFTREINLWRFLSHLPIQ